MPVPPKEPSRKIARKLAAFASRFLAGILILLPLAKSLGQENTNRVADLTAEVKKHLGQWIWSAETSDKQTCRFWKSFVIPAQPAVSHAMLHITVDNGYRLFLDGREIGRGSDWRTVTEYDLTWALKPGPHVLGVEGFNDRLEAGLIFSLEIELADAQRIKIGSDETWRIASGLGTSWAAKKIAPAEWPRQKWWEPSISILGRRSLTQSALSRRFCRW